jgi:AcrR family transcriptional regulator
VITDSPTRLRADAARNAERILRAAREVFSESGPDAPLEEIAQRAGVGIRTLFRRFPSKGALARAAIDQSIAESISPAVERALEDENPLRGLATAMEAAVSMAAREHSALAAARHSDSLGDVSTRFYESLTVLAHRAQEAGLIRGDLVPDDLRRIMVMLISVLSTMDPRSDGWQRYLALTLDALSPTGASPLPPAVPRKQAPEHENWPI